MIGRTLMDIKTAQLFLKATKGTKNIMGVINVKVLVGEN
jgi:hypothetical protein